MDIFFIFFIVSCFSVPSEARNFETIERKNHKLITPSKSQNAKVKVIKSK